jgi:predicted nucleotidyltransferase
LRKKIDIQKLAQSIQKNCPSVLFAYIFGSAQNGIIQDNADIDIAVYLSDKNTKETVLLKVTEIVDQMTGGISADIVFLNDTGPVLSFEVLRSRQLFVREKAMDEFAGFYSLTCREYESESFWMKKQLEYRNYEVQWHH